MSHFERNISSEEFDAIAKGEQRAVIVIGGFTDGDTMRLNEVKDFEGIDPTGQSIDVSVPYAFSHTGLLSTYQCVIIDVLSVNKTAPVQDMHGRFKPGIIPWSLHEKAWVCYSDRFGSSQSAETIAERGGFGASELDIFVPGWRELIEGDVARTP